MKSLISKIIFVLALLPATLFADIRGDMGNRDLSLVQVVQNALDQGMEIDAVVAEMIRINASESNAIVAAAMVVAPNSYEAIVTSAINAGADAANVVTVAIVASNGRNSDGIVRAAQRAAPASERQRIRNAADNALAQRGGPTATPGPRVAATRVVSSGGGGAASTAQEIQTVLDARDALQLTIDAVRAQLDAAGYTDPVLTTALDNLETALRNEQANLASIDTGLQALRDQVNNGATTAEILAGLDDLIASASGGGPTG